MTGRKEIHIRLDTCDIGGICDPQLNQDIYKLGLALDCELVGIDLDEESSSFQQRESNMKGIIQKYLDKSKKCVVVVGDAHE